VTRPRLLKAPLIILLGALLLRLLYMNDMVRSPYFGAPFLDELYNYTWAQSVAHGHLLAEKPFFRAPLYAYLLGGLFSVAGPDLLVPKLLQHLLGSLAAVIIFLLARRAFQRNAVGVLAGILAACYAPFIFFEGELLDISLQVFFYPLILLLALKLIETPRLPTTAILGAVIGLSAIARPAIIVFLPVLLVFLWINLRDHLPAASLRLKHMAVMLSLTVVVIAPVTVHNAVVGKSFVPIATYGSINFYIGNNAHADGFTSQTPVRYLFFDHYRDSVELFAEREAALMLGHTPTAAEISHYWRTRAWHSIRDYPLHFLHLLWKKFVLFWNSYEIKNNKNIYFVASYSPVLRILLALCNFGLIAPIAILGCLVSLWRHRTPSSLLLVLFVATYMLTVIMFFVNARYRLPVVPVLICFAAFGAIWVAEHIRQLNFRPLLPAAVCLGLFFWVVNANWFNIQSQNVATDHWSVANCYKEKQQYQQALLEYQKAIANDPDYADAYNNKGETYYLMGNYQAAIGPFEKTIELNPGDPKGYNNLGACYEAQGMLAKACEYYQEALRIAPDHIVARCNLGECFVKQNDIPRALRTFQEALRLDRNNARVHYWLAICYLHEDNSELVKLHLQEALRYANAALRERIQHDSRFQLYM
jgi:Tfp pilus assembly protein PilF/4-amino-4-deoxy-L-arabinose transferase-like glycosyltransferase